MPTPNAAPEADELEDKAKVEALRLAIQEGDESGLPIDGPTVIEQVRERIRRRAVSKDIPE